MKSPTQQRVEKAQRVAELIEEQAKALLDYMNPSLSEQERHAAGFRVMIITEVDLPLVLQTPIQLREHARGGMAIVNEQGPERYLKTGTSIIANDVFMGLDEMRGKL